jgi:hypothetical protein
MKNTCGNCKHFIHQKLEKYGYDGYCRTFPRKIGVTELNIYEVYLTENSEICEHFEKIKNGKSKRT